MATAMRAIGRNCRTLMSAAAATTKSTVTPATATAIPKAVKAPKAAKAADKPKAPSGILKPTPVSPKLSVFLGGQQEVARTEAIKLVWDHIKSHNLQNPANKKEIMCDEKLKTLFGKDKVSFIEIAKLLSQHFVKKA